VRVYTLSNRFGIDLDRLDFDDLPPREQRVLNEVAVRLVLGWTLEEIAEALAMTKEEVQADLARLRRELRRRQRERPDG
jgi:DNA-directed RNA polymerase specialized sigma24 family protein